MSYDVTDLVGYKYDQPHKAWLGAFFIGAVGDGPGDTPQGHYELLSLSNIEKRQAAARAVGDRDAALEYNSAARAISETAQGLRATPNDLPVDFNGNLFEADNGELFKVIDPRGDVDWAEYEVAQKTAKVKGEYVPAGTTVETIMADGLREASRTAGPEGGYRVTAQTGEQYLVDKAKFEKIYDQTDVPGVFAPKPDPRKVVPLGQNVAFPSPWGEGSMHIRKGGVMVYGGKIDIYGIQPAEFAASYELA